MTGDQFIITHNGVITADITLANGETVDALVTKINNAIQAAETADTADFTDLVATNENGQIKLTSAKGGTITVGAGTVNGRRPWPRSASALRSSLPRRRMLWSPRSTGTPALTDKVRASNDNGQAAHREPLDRRT